MANVDALVMIIVCLVFSGIGAYLYLEQGAKNNIYADCVHANSTEFIAVYMACPKEIDELVHNGGWEINTFGDDKVYMTKRVN